MRCRETTQAMQRSAEQFRALLDRGGVVQVAGIKCLQEALDMASCGADLIGFPFRLAYHGEDISEEDARLIIPCVRVPAVLITYLHSPEEILELCESLGVGVVQLHGEISGDELLRLRGLSDVGIIKSLVVKEHNLERLLGDASEMEACVDAFITDTFDPETGACGATGKTHDWSVSRELVLKLAKPVILAGGLTPDNVQAAIRCVGPAGVDVHTGIEDATGDKSPDNMRSFASEAALGFQRVGLRC